MLRVVANRYQHHPRTEFGTDRVGDLSELVDQIVAHSRASDMHEIQQYHLTLERTQLDGLPMIVNQLYAGERCHCLGGRVASGGTDAQSDDHPRKPRKCCGTAMTAA